jgi:hypothetical protein
MKTVLWIRNYFVRIRIHNLKLQIRIRIRILLKGTVSQNLIDTIKHQRKVKVETMVVNLDYFYTDPDPATFIIMAKNVLKCIFSSFFYPPDLDFESRVRTPNQQNH